MWPPPSHRGVRDHLETNRGEAYPNLSTLIPCQNARREKGGLTPTQISWKHLGVFIRIHSFKIPQGTNLEDLEEWIAETRSLQAISKGKITVFWGATCQRNLNTEATSAIVTLVPLCLTTLCHIPEGLNTVILIFASLTTSYLTIPEEMHWKKGIRIMDN